MIAVLLLAASSPPAQPQATNDTINWSNWALVVTGFGGIAVGIYTLKYIASQARVMRHQSVVLRYQTKATQRAAEAAVRSADVAEKALILAERADVLIDSVGLVTDIPGISFPHPLNPYAHLIVVFKNFGRTRAENVQCLLRIIIPGVPESEPVRQSFSLGAGGTQRVAFETFKATLTKETYDQVASGKIAMRFSGVATYNDIFKGFHTLECRGILDPKTGTFLLGENLPGE